MNALPRLARSPSVNALPRRSRFFTRCGTKTFFCSVQLYSNACTENGLLKNSALQFFYEPVQHISERVRVARRRTPEAPVGLRELQREGSDWDWRGAI